MQMKTRILASIALTLLFSAACTDVTGLYVGQFNVRNNGNSMDAAAGNGWDRRCPVVCGIIDYEHFDIFGSQEVLHDQLEDMLEMLPDYGYVGVGREDGKTKGEYAPIFYRKDAVSCLDNGTFWLSETPDVVASVGWDARYCRICTWGRFESLRTGARFWMFNLHMDHKGIEARREGAKLVLDKMKEMCGDEPFILTGDFNVDQTNEIYGIITGSGLVRDSYETAGRRFAETGTMNYFNPDYRTDSRIDHIFVSDGVEVEDYGVLTYAYWTPVDVTPEMQAAIDAGVEGVAVHRKRTPSDHYPVGAHILIR